MNNSNKNNGMSAGEKIAMGAGALALAAASYYFLGPEGKQHRKQAKGWMIKAKGEIVEKLEEAKEISEPIYHGIVDSVVAPYIAKGAISREEIEEFGRRIKSQWKQISKGASPKKKKTIKKSNKK